MWLKSAAICAICGFISQSLKLSLAQAAVAIAAALLLPRAGAETAVLRTEFPAADGAVHAIAVDEASGIVYIGGEFTAIGGQARSRLAALDLKTGALLPWNPGANDAVYAIIADESAAIILVAGAFTRIGIGDEPISYVAGIAAATGEPQNLFAVDFNNVVRCADMSLGAAFFALGGDFTVETVADGPDTGFSRLAIFESGEFYSGQADNSVRALAHYGTTLFAGGDFTKIGVGAPARNRIAAVDAHTGTATLWNPDANGSVQALAVGGSVVYAGGFFTQIGGQGRTGLAALDLISGLATAWNPAPGGDQPATIAAVQALALAGSAVYAGGTFTKIGGQSRSRLAALDTVSAKATGWNPGPNGTVTSVAISGSTVFVGGAFTTICGVSHPSFAAITDTSLIPASLPVPSPSIELSGKPRRVADKGRITIRGTAKANGGAALDRVEGKVGKGGYKPASGKENWSFKARLKPGRNIILLRAVAAGGIVSESAKVVVIFR